jgi:hypothetical protein
MLQWAFAIPTAVYARVGEHITHSHWSYTKPDLKLRAS